MHNDVPGHITEGLLQAGSGVVPTVGATGTAGLGDKKKKKKNKTKKIFFKWM